MSAHQPADLESTLRYKEVEIFPWLFYSLDEVIVLTLPSRLKNKTFIAYTTVCVMVQLKVALAPLSCSHICHRSHRRKTSAEFLSGGLGASSGIWLIGRTTIMSSLCPYMKALCVCMVLLFVCQVNISLKEFLAFHEVLQHLPEMEVKEELPACLFPFRGIVRQFSFLFSPHFFCYQNIFRLFF